MQSYKSIQRVNILTIFGMISMLYWCIDVLNNIFFLHSPSWSLWFSSVGIGLTAIGLLTRNTFLLCSLFCALFVVELAWNVGFFSHVLFHKSVFGLTDYLFTGNYATKDFLITTYHIVMIPFILAGILLEGVVHKTAWVGSLLFAIILLSFTYIFSSPDETTNCVHSLDSCKVLFFMEHISNPLRTIIGVAIMTIFVFIPTNYLLVKFMRSGKFDVRG